ncbi:MAG TPA: glycosyltransferase family 4 protein [Verrucomicrobiota bacterium]|nr:hypothetical protein [Verrucomicrobiales bacterium]HRI13867.1 glycosyltransferase family 4 protein [Verrucomicrobiota bacterium]
MTTPRRLLFVDRSRTALGGPEFNLVELLASSSARSRWETCVACPPGSLLEAALNKVPVPRHAYGIPADGGKTSRTSGRFSPLAKLRAWRELEPATDRLHAIISGFRPDAIVSCTNVDHFAAGAAAARSHIPSIWWVNEIISSDFLTWPLRRIFRKRASQWATRLLPVSDFARSALLHEGIPADRVTTVHNGIPLARYQRSTSTLLRDRLRLAPGEPLIGTVGRLTPWKGQDFFLRLAKEWAAQGRGGRFVIVGRPFAEDTSFETSLKKYVRAHRLSSRVHFVAFQADLAATLSQLDVLVHCSTKPEPFGRVIIEAMSVKVPVIAARAGGVPEIITAGVNGGLAKPGSVESYIAELTALLGDPRKRAAWAAAGRRTVTQRFSLDRVFNDFERVLSEVTAK